MRLHDTITLVDVGWRRGVDVNTTGQGTHERRKAESTLGKRVSLSFALGSSTSVEFDTRGDVIDVLAQVLGNVVSSEVVSHNNLAESIPMHLLVTSNVNVTRVDMLPLVVLSLEEASKLLSSEVKLHPLLVERLSELLDASRSEPFRNSIDGVLGWSKDLRDLLTGVVLAEVGGVVTRDIHEHLMTLVQVGLSEANTDGEQCSIWHICTLDPASLGHITLLVEGVRDVDCRQSKRSCGQGRNDGENTHNGKCD